MRIAIIGQQDFGKAVLEAFLARGDEVAGVFCAPGEARRAARCAQGRRAGERRQVFQFASLKSDEAQAGAERARRRDRHHGVRAAVRAAGFRQDPEARHDPVPPVAAAEVPRAVVDQLADHPRRDADRADDLPPDRRARRRPGGPAEGRRRSARTTRSARSTSTGCSRWACRRCWKRPTSWWPASTRETVQDESQATYEGWCRKAEARIHWASHVDSRLQPDPRLQSGARRLDHARRQEAADLRRAQDPGAHLRRGQGQDRRGRRGDRERASRSPRRAAASRCCAPSSADGKKVRRRSDARPDQARRVLAIKAGLQVSRQRSCPRRKYLTRLRFDCKNAA